jgi:hypothetical protein
MKPRAVASMPASGRDDAAQAADLDPQAGAMRLVGMAGAKGVRDQGLAPDVAGPRLRRARAPGRTAPAGAPAAARPRRRAGRGGRHRAPACRGEQGGDLVEAERLLLARGEAAGGGPLQGGLRLVDLGLQGGHLGARGGLAGAGERGSGGADPQRAQCQLGRGQRDHRRQRGRQHPSLGRTRAPPRARQAHARSRRGGRAGAAGGRR